MLVGQAEGLLGPSTPEAIWGLVSLALILGFGISVVGVLVWAKRASQRRGQPESRVERLEKAAFEDRSS